MQASGCLGSVKQEKVRNVRHAVQLRAPGGGRGPDLVPVSWRYESPETTHCPLDQIRYLLVY